MNFFQLSLADFQIPPEDLYEHFFRDNSRCLPATFEAAAATTTAAQRTKYACWEQPDQLADYGCRYARGARCGCYCCGQLLYFVEHGTVCTRYCLLSDEAKLGKGLRS